MCEVPTFLKGIVNYWYKWLCFDCFFLFLESETFKIALYLVIQLVICACDNFPSNLELMSEFAANVL